MILVALTIAGFGRLTDREFAFAPGLNVVYGPNESGKSTLAGAIIATLYGVERKKDRWRPWSDAPFATSLVYRLGNGEQIEVRRAFDRDGKGLNVYDRNGNDLSPQLGAHRTSPGEAHLGIPLDVFINAACVRQQEVAIEEGRDAASIATHLARALDGGPREDAALGALARLDAALRDQIGTDRSRKPTPLRELRTAAEAQRAELERARAELDALDEVRAQLERADEDCTRYLAAQAEIERRLRSMRAGTIVKQLAAVREFRAELADLQAARAAYDDVADFSTDRAAELDDAYATLERTAREYDALRAESERVKLSDEELREYAERRRDAGAIDDTAFEQLGAAHEHAERLREKSAAAAREAAATADTPAPPRDWWLVGAILTFAFTVGLAIAHTWTWTGVALAITLALVARVVARARKRAQRARAVRERRQAADDARSEELAASAVVSRSLEPLGLTRFEELAARRTRWTVIRARKAAADAAVERLGHARGQRDAAACRFDAMCATVVPGAAGDPAARRAYARARAARKRERDGIDAHVYAVELRKSTLVNADEETALEAERDALAREGIEPADNVTPEVRHTLEDEFRAAGEQLRIARDTRARLAGVFEASRDRIPDLATLEETLAHTQTRIARLEAFERAVLLARTTLDSRTQEAHRAFARRLEDYAAESLGAITGGRYGELRVDPATLAVRVRVPETGRIVDLDSVSAGTRDQAYLVVRFAMARMFAEGLETPPLVLDDPFAYWDAARIERCLPILEHGARDAQAIVLTASRELAEAATARGAHRIDLPEPAAALR